jgi:hypothetical protein
VTAEDELQVPVAVLSDRERKMPPECCGASGGEDHLISYGAYVTVNRTFVLSTAWQFGAWGSVLGTRSLAVSW